MMPTFLGIGAQRCGTTWAYHVLSSHPEIFVSTPKELRYFTANYDKGRSWYESNFDDAGDAKVWGEITPGYVYRPAAIERIAEDLPEVRLFAILRNPIERAFSAYRFFYERDYRGLTFAEALQRDTELLEQGRYADSLERLWRLFPREHCLVMLFDDLRTSPDEVARKLYEFLGVDPEFEPSGIRERVNNPVLPRTQNILKKLGLESTIDLVKKSSLGPPIRAWYANRRGPDQIPDADKRALRTFYEQDISEVGRKLGRDLGYWLD